MARRASKNTGTEYADFSDAGGGWNCRDAKENIEANELSDVKNMTFSNPRGRLSPRAGTGDALCVFDEPVDGMTWYRDSLRVVSGGRLWTWNGASLSEAGNVGEELRPSFCEYGGELFIAAGEKLYKFDGLTLLPVEGSYPDTAGLFMRDGRLCCWRTSPEFADYIYASAAGDPLTWEVPSGERTDADPVEIEIGYKMAGEIVAVAPMLSDLIVFKRDLVMRLTGGLIGTQGIYEVARNINIANKWSVSDVGGSLFYIDRTKGAQALQGVESYGDILPADVLRRANPYIRERLSEEDCRLWLLKRRNILVFGLGGNVCVPAYYAYGDDMPALRWEFDGAVRDIAEPDRDRLFIALENRLYSMTAEYDEGHAGVPHGWTTKCLTGPSFFLLKRVMTKAQPESGLSAGAPVEIYANDVKYAEMIFEEVNGYAVYGNTDPVLGNETPVMAMSRTRNDFTKHQTYRSETLMFRFSCEEGCSPYTMSQFRAELVPVGVIG